MVAGRRSQVSGPGTSVFADSASASTTVSFDQLGTYILRLTGDDGVLSATGDVVVTVTNADLTTIRSMYGGGVTRVRVYNDSTSTVISNTVHFGLAGALGSTGRTVGNDGTDSGIIRYTPYGTARTGDVADLAVDQTFTGQTNDPGTGLIDYNARQYDPVLAKFIQPDTIVPDMANPQDLNRYMYVRGNPVNMTDPSGHLPGMNPATAKEERGYFARTQAFWGDVEGAFDFCDQGLSCYDEDLDYIANRNIFFNGERFDDGKHNDGKMDGDIREGDFKAVRDNKHGNASELDQWTAGWLLARDLYDGYGDNSSWYQRGAFGVIWKYRDQIALGLAIIGAFACAVCSIAFYASVGVTAVSASYSCATGDGVGCALGITAVATGGLSRGAQNLSRTAKVAGDARLAASRWRLIQRNLTGPLLLGVSEASHSAYLATSTASFAASSVGLLTDY